MVKSKVMRQDFKANGCIGHLFQRRKKVKLPALASIPDSGLMYPYERIEDWSDVQPPVEDTLMYYDE
jgi:hypothetical protein